MTRRGLCALVLFACAACGVRPVELLPVEQPVAEGSDEFVDGQVPAEALARLRSQRSEQGEELLHLMYPAPPELIVPADLAPIRFEWHFDPKAKPEMMMGMPMNMPMGMGMMGAAAEAQPRAAGAPAPPADPMAGPKPDKGKMPEKADKDRPIAYELRARSEQDDVRLYSAAQAGAFPYERWRALLRAHSGGTLRIELRGVYQNGEIAHAPALELKVRAAMPAGLFYSFSATGQGINVGQLAHTHERALPVPATASESQSCVGCHAVSRNGKQMLATNAARTQLLRWSLVSNEDAIVLDWPEAPAELGYIQATFDLSAARIAATAAGQLLIFDANSGALLQQTGMPLMASVSNPDWSPDNLSIVVEVASGKEDAEGGSLGQLELSFDGRMTALQTLVEATGDEHLRAPVYSPDGEWIAYERRMGPPGEGKDSKLFLVRASGGEPIELKALSRGMKPMDGASSPAFAPADEPGHAYLLFTSHRPVGTIMPLEGQRQLFASEIDFAQAAKGDDPSHTAFWLPFQQRSNSYLRVQWAEAQTECTATTEVCDGVDDNCDGVVDNGCCTPAAEACDGKDDDCDGRVDEGCECAFQETCGNQVDDDCDLKVDEKPCGPGP